MSLETNQLEDQLKKFEIRFISGSIIKDEFTDSLIKLLSSSNVEHHLILSEIVQFAVNHDYKAILNFQTDFLKPIENFYHKNKPVLILDCGVMKSNYIESSDKNSSYVYQLIMMLLSVSALQEFLTHNLCGPSSAENIEYSVLSKLFPDDIYTDDRILDELSRNGETILTKLHHPKLLYMSLVLLSSDSFSDCITYKWWLLRCLFIQQRILPAAIPDLHDTISILIKQLVEIYYMKDESELLNIILFYTECAHVHLHYHKVNLAEKCINEACNRLDLKFELTGAVGKRTRFQTKPVAQLVLKKSVKNDNQTHLSKSSHLPKDLALVDDTILNEIEYISMDDNKSDKVSAEEQLVVLAHCCLIQKKMASTDLKHEEVMAYVNFLLSQPKIWAVHFKALAIRCQVEKIATRKFDRSRSQLEELINTISRNEPIFSVRQTAMYCVAFPFKYNLEKLLAEIFIEQGSVKSALEIYERLHLWEDAVLCYKQLGMTVKAIEVLDRLIAVKSRPILWCYLGDVTNDPEKYITAWELSEHKNARSQCSLGYYYLKKKDFEKCIPHFILSTEVNHLQPTVWFTLGYVATEIGNYVLAARAYRQVVLLDNDNFEAWNNLSNAYIKLKQKERAWRSLQEALKCNYEEWKVWENFLIVSVDIGAFEDVIRSYHRLLDIKGKHLDTEVLRILVDAICKNLPDMQNLSSFRLKDKSLQLFGRLTSITTNNAEVWELYSILLSSGTDLKNDKNTLDKAVSFQHKAIRSLIQNSAWEEDINALRSTLKSAQRFVELSIAYVELLEEPSSKQQQKSLAKYSLQNIITKAERASSRFSDDFPNDSIGSLKNSLNSLISL